MERHSSTLRIHHYHHHHHRRRHHHYHEKKSQRFFLSNWVAALSSELDDNSHWVCKNMKLLLLFSLLRFSFCFPHSTSSWVLRLLRSFTKFFFSKATELHSCLKQSEFPFSFITHTDYLNKRFCFLFPPLSTISESFCSESSDYREWDKIFSTIQYLRQSFGLFFG